MLFNSLEFLIFLPIVFLLYWFIFNCNVKVQNLFIVIVSYVFYGWWDWHFLTLIAFTTFCSYLSGLALIKSQNLSKWIGKYITIANIIINLLVLGVYKYYDFFVSNFVDAFASIGITLQVSTLDLVLPVGISFYTFQALSYTIDIYRKKLEPTTNIVEFFAYISFFPQLVAGPIERATNLLPQFQKKRTFHYDMAVDGVRQILWGLFKKIVVADNCAVAVNIIFADYTNHSGLTLIIGAVLFTFQIYGDFSGYSDIAIGTARLFGINLMRNFAFPYFSRDIAEFWRRWHISLTTWFRDYIYIPLGGSRCSKWKVCRNTLIIFLVSGLWHGANWTFVCWGLYHALLFFPLLLLGVNRKYTSSIAERKLLPSLTEFCQMLFTFTLVVIGWIIFRSESISDAWAYIYYIPTHWGIGDVYGLKALFFASIMIVVEWNQREKQFGLQGITSINHMWIRYAIYYCIILSLVFFNSGGQQQFIYFQF